MAKLSYELEAFFFSEERAETVALADVLALSGERAFGFFFVLLSLPSALPIPAPGYSVPFGIVILLLSAQLLCGKIIPWLPDSILNRPFQLDKIQGILKTGLPWLRRIEAISRPRLTYVCISLTGRLLIGGLVSLMAISMMIPIPGTNTLPAIGVFVSGFGLLEDDGLISLVGLGVCILGGSLSLSILIAVIYGGVSLADWLKEQLILLLN